jgi:hypothetical protein
VLNITIILFDYGLNPSLHGLIRSDLVIREAMQFHFFVTVNFRDWKGSICICTLTDSADSRHGNVMNLENVKAIPATGREGPYACEKSRLPHFVDNRLTDGREVVSLMHWPPFTSRKIPGTHFCSRLSRPQGHSEAGRIRLIEKSNDLIGNRTRYFLACSIVPQPTTLPCAPI